MGVHKIYQKLVIRGGTGVYNLVVYTNTLTPASVTGSSAAEQTFTVTGLDEKDLVLAINTKVGTPCGIVGYRVSATDTLAIKFVNPTDSNASPSAGTYKIVTIRTGTPQTL